MPVEEPLHSGLLHLGTWQKAFHTLSIIISTVLPASVHNMLPIEHILKCPCIQYVVCGWLMFYSDVCIKVHICTGVLSLYMYTHHVPCCVHSVEESIPSRLNLPLCNCASISITVVSK